MEANYQGMVFAMQNGMMRNAFAANMNAALPTLDELKGILDSCGGKFDDYNMHKDDPAFQSCSKKNGFAVFAPLLVFYQGTSRWIFYGSSICKWL